MQVNFDDLLNDLGKRIGDLTKENAIKDAVIKMQEEKINELKQNQIKDLKDEKKKGDK